MGFVKIQKNNTYYKRFQVKFRRRREGKTDYYQRKRLIIQRKNKYNTPKWRFVVRRTNQRIICQVVWSTITGDKVKTQADSYELRRFGLTAGLTNYAAAYCTGLLTARRLLTQLDEENKQRQITSTIAKSFNLVPEATGEYVDISKLAQSKGVEQRPFTCYLDLGLARATVGNRVFAALKGAVDGGLHIPHSEKIFPQPKTEKKGGKDAKPAATTTTGGGAALLRERIFGVHVQNYLDKLKKTPSKINTQQFKLVNENLSTAKVKNLEELYKKVHAAIRANPSKVVKPKKTGVKHVRDTKNPQLVTVGKKVYRRDLRLTNEQRKQRVAEKIRKFIKERQRK